MQAKIFNYVTVALSLSTAIPSVMASQATIPEAASAPAAVAPDSASATSASVSDTTVVARVTLDGVTTEVTLGQLKERLKLLPPQVQSAPFEKIYEMLLSAQVDMMIVSHAAGKENYPQKHADRVKAAGEAIIQKTFLDDEIKKLITDADLKTFYDQVVKALPPVEEARIRQITFGDEKKAKEALTELKKGTDFEKVLTEAQQKDSAVKGGDMNYVRIDDLPEPMAKRVKVAAKATLIPDVIKTDMGFHVIRVDDKRPHPTPTFEEAKPELTTMIAPKYLQQVVEGLRKGVKIEKFKLDGTPMQEAPAAPVAEAASVPAAAPAA